MDGRNAAKVYYLPLASAKTRQLPMCIIFILTNTLTTRGIRVSKAGLCMNKDHSDQEAENQIQ
jgi:hypothetical protein